MPNINLDDQTTWPEQGTQWEHTTGRVYSVMLYANVGDLGNDKTLDRSDPRRDRYPITIVYRNMHNDQIYCRRLDDWERSFKLSV